MGWLMPKPSLQDIQQEISGHLAMIARLFVDPKITIVIRQPGNDEGDVVLTDDEFDEAIEALRRTRRRARAASDKVEVDDIIALKSGTRRYRVTAEVVKAGKLTGYLATPCRQRFFGVDDVRKVMQKRTGKGGTDADQT
jgi:hypothetical protein